MKSDLEEQISQLMSAENSCPLLMSKLNTTVILIIQLCQRSSLVNDISEKQRDKMWFALLDCLMKPQNNDLKSLIKHVLTSSMGHISLHSVVDKILREPGYQSDNLGWCRFVFILIHYFVKVTSKKGVDTIVFD